MTYIMKDSGIEWIGMIPEHWEVKKLKKIFINKKNINTNIDEIVLSLSYGNIKIRDLSTNKGLIPESILTYQIVEKEDIVCRLTDMQNDKKSLRNAISPFRGVVSSAYLVLTIKEKNNSFFFNYFLRSLDTNKIWYNLGGGIRQSVKWNDIKNILTYLPPQKEQEAIASYLDKHVGNLDKYIDLATKKIKLLEEQKTALIYETVTRGLNPDVKMKDSEIEWIGIIPEHWEIKRVKNFYHLSMGKTILKEDLKENGNIPVYSATAEDKYFGYLEKSNHLMKRGDLVIPARGTIGFVKRAIQNSIATQTTIIARNKFVKYNDFCFYYLNGLRKQIFKYDQTAIPQITVFQVGSYFLPIPPQKEQETIASYLDTKCSRIDKEVELLKKKVELLKEYKTSLIFEVVTGKKNVI